MRRDHKRHMGSPCRSVSTFILMLIVSKQTPSVWKLQDGCKREVRPQQGYYHTVAKLQHNRGRTSETSKQNQGRIGKKKHHKKFLSPTPFFKTWKRRTGCLTSLLSKRLTSLLLLSCSRKTVAREKSNCNKAITTLQPSCNTSEVGLLTPRSKTREGLIKKIKEDHKQFLSPSLFQDMQKDNWIS